MERCTMFPWFLSGQLSFDFARRIASWKHDIQLPTTFVAYDNAAIHLSYTRCHVSSSCSTNLQNQRYILNLTKTERCICGKTQTLSSHEELNAGISIKCGNTDIAVFNTLFPLDIFWSRSGFTTNSIHYKIFSLFIFLLFTSMVKWSALLMGKKS